MITLKHMQTESHHIKQDQTDTFVDVDEALTERIQQEAIAHQSSAQNKSEQAELDRQADFDGLLPSDKRLAIERHYTPIIQKLAKQHEELCDQVADFEDNQTRYRADLQAQFAYELKHPDVKTVICAGEHHFDEMIKTGGLHIEGYKLVEKRSLGGLIQMVNGVKVATPGSSRLIYIPVTVESLMSYAHSPEAQAHSRVVFEAELQRLINRRKKAAVALTEAKQKARDALAAIPTFEQLISDQVKKSAAKK